MREIGRERKRREGSERALGERVRLKEGEGEIQRLKNTMENELARQGERRIGRERERE